MELQKYLDSRADALNSIIVHTDEGIHHWQHNEFETSEHYFRHALRTCKDTKVTNKQLQCAADNVILAKRVTRQEQLNTNEGSGLQEPDADLDDIQYHFNNRSVQAVKNDERRTEFANMLKALKQSSLEHKQFKAEDTENARYKCSGRELSRTVIASNENTAPNPCTNNKKRPQKERTPYFEERQHQSHREHFKMKKPIYVPLERAPLEDIHETNITDKETGRKIWINLKTNKPLRSFQNELVADEEYDSDDLNADFDSDEERQHKDKRHLPCFTKDFVVD